MRSLSVALGASLLALLGACSKAPPSQAAPDPATSAPPAPATPAPVASAPSALHLGAPITGANAVALRDITAKAKTYEGQTVTTSGTVTAVCKSMGCWMEIKDDASEAHVTLAGHSFFVPKTSAGHHARVEGKVMKTSPDEECAEEAAEQTGKPVAKLQLEATGVELD